MSKSIKVTHKKPSRGPLTDIEYERLKQRILAGAEYALKSLDVVRDLTRGKEDPVIDAMDLRKVCDHFTALGLEMQLALTPIDTSSDTTESQRLLALLVKLHEISIAAPHDGVKFAEWEKAILAYQAGAIAT